MDFPRGSIEAECDLNEFPLYWTADGMRRGVPAETLASEECRIALETHINGINPYLWDRTIDPTPFALVVLDEPFTFERVFADPSGDMIRMQDAMSRPECLLKGDERNWELKETCHAESFLNYALIHHFCFDQRAFVRS